MLKQTLVSFFCLFATCISLANSDFNPSRYIMVSGKKVAVYESAGRRGPGILLVHGNTSSAESYREIIDSAFGKTFRLVALDLPGYGRSENAVMYSAGSFAQAIQVVAAATRVDHGILVGWSLGGDFVLQASTGLPHVQGYFLFGTAPLGVTPNLPSPFLSSSESYAGDAVNYGVIAGLTNQQIDDYVRAFFRPGYQNIPAFFFAAGRRTDPNTRAAVLTAATGQDPTFHDEVAIIRALHVPVAILLGENDAFVRPAYLNALAPSIPRLWRDEIKYVSHVGHAVHWETPTRFTLLLREFVGDL